MQKVRIGVVGAYRGGSMINYCKIAEHAQIVAICEKTKEVLNAQKENLKDFDISFYDNFDDFIEHDMDAVVLANYATEHAPLAIRALNRGLHVFSEVLPVQTMKEAVELVEAVERSGKVYAYGENYCFMPVPYEMKKLYQSGKIGEFEYGECEYLHNCSDIWHSITYGQKDHWRNNQYATFYCTHSLGPILHATKLRPVSVTGFEGTKNERKVKRGAKSGAFGMEMVQLENGGIIKSLHGDLYKSSVWYSMYGSMGRMESGRDDAGDGALEKLYINADEFEEGFDTAKREHYEPAAALPSDLTGFGHGGADYLCIDHFVQKILGNEDADIIDVYEALDMFLPGMFAYRSILDGGVPKQIPNLRNKEEREIWRNDTTCTDPKVAGDMLIPSFSKGNPEIDDAVYAYMKELWQHECEKEDGNYRAKVFKQGCK
ncbi:MAG: Gfo/Idh/MocA family oxidoreductase [Oscillospiraceae bacterium]|nr:Gfo/Idh/MocA family oxidoreductase [Oscillospiraceae bacterium]